MECANSLLATSCPRMAITYLYGTKSAAPAFRDRQGLTSGQITGDCMETITSTVTSKDGTRIVYDKTGHGPAVILVAGAMCSRNFWSGPELAKLLASRFTVYNYDRRGRGDSGDTRPYAVAREIDDIEALIDEAGGQASLYGHSSGAALAMEAALRLGKK